MTGFRTDCPIWLDRLPDRRGRHRVYDIGACTFIN